MLIEGKSAKSTYTKMEAERTPYLNRAELIAELTLPHLMPKSGYSGQTLPTPWQSVGARGVSSLSSKLLLALFPPSQSFIRLNPDARLYSQMTGTIRSEVDATLAQIENMALQELESMVLRPTLHETMKQLLVAGNVVLQIPESGDPKLFQLNRFVCKRDGSGNVLLLIIKESIAPGLLPDSVRDIVAAKMKDEPGHIDHDSVDIYTAICRTDPDTYEVWQEVCDCPIPETNGTYKADKLPWIVLRMDPVAGQSYSYGYVAGLLGDLTSLEGLMKALVEASAASARVVFLANPNMVMSLSQLNEAKNGSFVTGLPDDVVALKVDKAADMSVAFQAIERLQQSLGFAFLLNQSVQRKGERVTAEEIKFLAQELEDVMAGTYALLSQELQLRVAQLLLARLEKSKAIEKLDKKGIRPTIITGLEALGRGHDLAKLQTFVSMVAQSFGPEVLATYTNVSDFMTRIGTGLGLSLEGLIKNADQVQQEQQAAQQSQMLQSVAPEAVKQIGQTVQTNIKQK